MDGTMTTTQNQKKQSQVTYYDDGLAFDFGDGRTITAKDAAGAGLILKMEKSTEDEAPFVVQKATDDGRHITSVGLTNNACMALFLMLTHLHHEEYFGIEDLDFATPVMHDKRNAKKHNYE